MARQPFYSRSTLGYVVVSLGVALVSAVVFTPISSWVVKMFASRTVPIEQLTSSGSLTPTTGSPSSPNVTAQPLAKSALPALSDRHATIPVSAVDPQGQSLSLEYDSLKERFSAVNHSLKEREKDLGSLPLKPEITAALATTRDDLAATEWALKNRYWSVASGRMERVKKNLTYLESL